MDFANLTDGISFIREIRVIRGQFPLLDSVCDTFHAVENPLRRDKVRGS